MLANQKDWVRSQSQESVMRQILREVSTGQHVSPRGRPVKEVEDYTYFLKPGDRWQNFAMRKLSVDYVRREFLWYLMADRFDTSMTKYAKLWEACVGEDGGINSNYGQYLFGREATSVPVPPQMDSGARLSLRREYHNQFSAVISALEADRDTRRASMMIAQPWHFLTAPHQDYPCTYCVGFRIRGDELNMTVHMRSQDAIHGFGNDVPVFSLIHEMVWALLLPTYPELRMGMSAHHVDSFHVYERHWPMVDAIVYDGDEFKDVETPTMTTGEAKLLLSGAVFFDDFDPSGYPFLEWVTAIKSPPKFK